MSVLSSQTRSQWPKQRPALSHQQEAIINDWYGYWLPKQSASFGRIVKFNHEYAAATAFSGCRTLEIGAGNGEHLLYEDYQNHEYYALELREDLAKSLQARFPGIHVIVGDCQQRIDAPDESFDRVLAIHVLEHLADLPSTLAEVSRILRPNGTFSVVIPCEGGAGYQLGRQFSSKRMFQQRYQMDYNWMISYDHINQAREIMHELERRFIVKSTTYYPLQVPSVHLNLIIGLTLTKRAPKREAGPA